MTSPVHNCCNRISKRLICSKLWPRVLGYRFMFSGPSGFYHQPPLMGAPTAYLCDISQDIRADSFWRTRGHGEFQVCEVCFLSTFWQTSGHVLLWVSISVQTIAVSPWPAAIFVCDGLCLFRAAAGPRLLQMESKWHWKNVSSPAFVGSAPVQAKISCFHTNPSGAFISAPKERTVSKIQKSIGMESALSSGLLMALKLTNHICTAFQ